MNVLITGASGFLGGHLAEVFAETRHQGRALARRTGQTEFLEQQGVEIVRGDLKDYDSLRRAVVGVDVVVHAASTMGGIPQEYEEATVKGTQALLAAAEQAGVGRFVHISSIAVHDTSRQLRRDAITEYSPYESDPRFASDYVRSKIGAERAALDFSGSGKMQVAVVRPGILYGARGKWNLSRMGYPLGRKWYVIIGNGRNLLPVCHVRNCAQALLMAAEKEDIGDGVFNIIDDERFTQIEYLRRLKKEVRPRLKIIRFPYLLARLIALVGELTGKVLRVPCPIRAAHLIACHRRLAYSNEKAKHVLGWRPETGKEAALAETMRYYAGRERVSRRANLRVLGQPVAGERPLTACVVGCGVIAQEHLRVLSRMKNAKLLALCDLDGDAARDLAERFQVPRTYEDVAAMLEAETPDVVHILTPPQFHAQQAELAATNGCHVLVEKPMAMNAAEAKRMADVAARNGVQLCVDHNKLYDPVVVRARRLVESGDLGDILWVESYCGFDLGNNPKSRYMVPGGEKHWTFQIPGGLYQNLAPHPLCLALELVGKPTAVSAYARYGRVLPHAATDELRVVLETPKACALATIAIAGSPRQEYLKIFGTKMVIFVDILNQWLIPQRIIRGVPKPVSRAVTNIRHASTVARGTLAGMLKVLCRRWTPYEGMEILIREFYASLQDGREPPVTAEEGVLVMEIMDEVWSIIGPEAVGTRARSEGRDQLPAEGGRAQKSSAGDQTGGEKAAGKTQDDDQTRESRVLDTSR